MSRSNNTASNNALRSRARGSNNNPPQAEASSSYSSHLATNHSRHQGRHNDQRVGDGSDRDLIEENPLDHNFDSEYDYDNNDPSNHSLPKNPLNDGTHNSYFHSNPNPNLNPIINDIASYSSNTSNTSSRTSNKSTPSHQSHQSSHTSPTGYKIYRTRWLMLFHLSLLNLLSDWAGLSVAPIATLTSRAYNTDENGYTDYQSVETEEVVQRYIQPEALVTVFLIASSVGTALEPKILGRLGLRGTVVLGAFCNMVGSLVKSGGLPPISYLSVPSLHHGLYGTYALYCGFFFVGFAQPLFQCTPALLSASWFPESERTLATSIALNANQLGVGLAFVVGALWVQSPGQIKNYFSLLSFLSVAAFVGCVLQLEDAPPTPPSGSSRVMRGSMEVSVKELLQRASSSFLERDGGIGGVTNLNFDVGKLSNMAFGNLSHLGNLCGGEDTAGSVAGVASAYRGSANSKGPTNRANTANNATNTATNPTSWPPSLIAYSYSIDEYDDLSTYPGVEPTLTQTPHHLEINIRDDQIILAARACLSRKGFSHALVVFTVSGVVINTLSTYLDYLVRVSFHEDGEGSASQSGQSGNSESSSDASSSNAAIYVALIGGLFQIIIMLSSILVGSFADKTRSYFIVTLILLVLGAIALAECGVSLDGNKGGDGSDVRWTLLLVSGLLGPLLPVSAELGVEMAYPLSENTVLVILQLCCNLVSAAFIPLFQVVRNVGVSSSYSSLDGSGNGGDDGTAIVLGEGRPPYTFSFYLMILLCTASAVYFATFDGKYLRLEAEMEKKNGGEDQKRLLIPSASGHLDILQ